MSADCRVIQLHGSIVVVNMAGTEVSCDFFERRNAIGTKVIQYISILHASNPMRSAFTTLIIVDYKNIFGLICIFLTSSFITTPPKT